MPMEGFSNKDQSTFIAVTVCHSVTMKPMIPICVIQCRTKIRADKVSDGPRETHQGRDLIQEIRHSLNSSGVPFTRKQVLGAP